MSFSTLSYDDYPILRHETGHLKVLQLIVKWGVDEMCCDMIAFGNHFFSVKGCCNPSGSRNLEYDPKNKLPTKWTRAFSLFLSPYWWEAPIPLERCARGERGQYGGSVVEGILGSHWFFGKVIDEEGHPIASAKVRYTVDNTPDPYAKRPKFAQAARMEQTGSTLDTFSMKKYFTAGSGSVRVAQGINQPEQINLNI